MTTTAQTGAALPQAPYGRRAVAAIIDGALAAVASLPTFIGIAVGDPLGAAGLAGAGVGALLLLALAIVQLLLTARGGSIGSRMLGLGVRRDGTGAPLGIGRTLLRWLVLGAAGIVPVLGTALMLASILMDPQRRGRGWHDLAAGAFAVDARGRRPAHDAQRSASAPRPHTMAPSVGADEPYRPGQLAAAVPGAPQPMIDAVPGGGAPVLGGRAPSAPASASAPAPLRAEHAAPADAARWQPPRSAPEPPPAAAPAHPLAAPEHAQGAPTARPALADELDEATVRRAPAVGAELDDDLERTHVVRRGPSATVRIDDGDAFRIAGLALLGRNPAASEGETVAHLVPLGADSRTVSKTHLSLQPTRDGLVVIDLGSTNGSALLHAGLRSELEPHRAVLAITGDVIELGDHRLEVVEHAG